MKKICKQQFSYSNCPKHWFLKHFLIVILTGMLYAQPALAQKPASHLYFTGNYTVARINLETGRQDTVATTFIDRSDIAFDPIEREIYWNSRNKIWRADTDGVFEEILSLSFDSGVRSFAFDSLNRHLYWIKGSGQSYTSDISILRSNLDGSDQQTIISSDSLSANSQARFIEIDIQKGLMYWLEGPGNLMRTTLDGKEPILIADSIGVYDFVPEEEAIFYRPRFGQGIYRMDAEGNGAEVVLPESPSSLDYFIRKIPGTDEIYWSSMIMIGQTNLTSARTDTLAFSLFSKRLPLVDKASDKLYWAESGAIMRANLDGTDQEELITSPISPRQIVSDPSRGYIYWHDHNRILRYDVNTALYEKIYTVPDDEFSISALRMLAMDTTHNQLYFMSDKLERMKRLDLSSGEIFDLAGETPPDYPIFLSPIHDTASAFVNGAEEKLYWWNEGGALTRSNLDGSDFEILFSDGFVRLERFYIDHADSTMYWESGSRLYSAKIDLDIGSLDYAGREEFSEEQGLKDFAVDPVTRTIYFHKEHYWFMSSSLDNPGVDTLFTLPAENRIGLPVVHHLALMFDDPGTFVSTQAQEVLPSSFSISNYPNPFQNNTSLSFVIQTPQHVVIDVYDMLGRRISRVHDQELLSGRHEINWQGTNLAGASVPPGLYAIRVVLEHEMHTHMVVKAGR